MPKKKSINAHENVLCKKAFFFFKRRGTMSRKMIGSNTERRKMLNLKTF